LNASLQIAELACCVFESPTIRTHERMTKNQTAQLLKGPQSANSLTHVLDQSERVKDIVEECADELSSVNTGLKRELEDGDVSPGVANALEMSEAVEGKVQDASEALSLVNSALKEQIDERHVLDAQLVTVTKQGNEARHASLHDPLTGLPNRALFNDRLEHGLAADNFKTINDTYGHDVGDLVLQMIAGRLKETTRDDDTVCRHGGDEFLYILVNIESEQDIAIVAKKIINAIQAPCDIQVRDISIRLSINPSIGISIFPKDGTNSEALLDVADKAMYRAKHSKCGYSFAGDE
jgi:diguanylate cyclase (GGDEF)-like protein